MKRLFSLAAIAMTGALIIATGVSALVTNGDFETGTFGSWTKSAFINNGFSAAQGSGGADLSAIVGGPAVAPLSLSDPRTNNALQYPAYGHYTARVNNEESYSSGGHSQNANMITQTISAYVDPSDNLSHTKFAYAAVMVNPGSGHTDEEKPYFRVRAINQSNGNDVLYDFASYVNEPGKNWQNGASFGSGEFWKYLNWQVIDLTSTPQHPVNAGDTIRIEVSSAGCSLGGHPGYVYVDEITDNEIAGPTVKATGPATVGSGSTITYTYNYKNGYGSPIDPTITATQPSGVTFTSVSDNTNCSLSSGTVTCNYTGVPAGGSGSFTVQGNVTASVGSQIAHGAYSIAATGFPTVGGQTVLSNVISAATTTSVTSSNNPSVHGQGVTFTATVAPTVGGGTPTGTVQFVINGSNFGSPVTLVGGVAQLSTSALPTGGPFTVVANYAGAPGFNPSNGSLSGGQTINRANTTTAISSSPDPSNFGQTVTLTANVAAVSPGSGTPTGTIQFAVDGVNLGSPVALSGGIAQTTTSAMSVGNRTVQATYSGSSDFNGSSNTDAHTVETANTTTSVGSSQGTSTYGDTVTFTATVTTNAPGSGIPGGTVNFFDGPNPIPGCQNVPVNGSGQAVCAVSNLVGGPHSISAVYGGNGSFNGGNGNVSQTVNKAVLGVTASSHNVTYGDTAPTVTPAYTGFVLGQGPSDLTTQPSCSTTYSAGSSVAGSPYTTSCAGGVSGNYDFAPTAGSVSVAQAPLTITASTHNITFGDSTPTITPSYSAFVLSEGPGSLTAAPSCSTTYTTGATAAGSPYATSCTGAASGNYAISYTAGSVNVAKATLTVTASSHNVTYGDNAPAVTPSYDGFVLGQGPGALTPAPTCTTTYSAMSPVNGSPYSTTCAGGVSDSYAFSYVAGTVGVAKAALTVTASSHSVVFGATAPAVSPSYAGFVGGENAADLLAAPSCGTNYAPGSPVAGSPYVSTCSAAVSDNYSFIYVPGSVNVSRAELRIIASSHSVTFGEAAPLITPTYSGFVVGQSPADLTATPTCSTTYETGSPATGSPYSSICFGAVSANYTLVYVAGTVTIGRAMLTVTASSHTVAFGDAAPTITPSYSGFIPGHSVINLATVPSCTTTYAAGTPVAASGTATVCSGAVSANYDFTYVNGSVTITKAPLNVAGPSPTVFYGDASPAMTPVYSGFKAGNGPADLATQPVCSSAYSAGSNVAGSPYTTTCNGGVSANYSFNYAPGQITVNKKALNVTGNDVSRAYGSANPSLAATISGFVLGQTLATSGVTGTPAVSTTATATSPVGGNPYSVNVALGTLQAANYSFNLVNGALTVEKAVVNVAANNTSRVFGTANPAFTAQFTGFVNGEVYATSGITGTAGLVSSATTTSPVGPYPIVASAGSLAAGNYSFTYTDGTLTVTKAPTTTVITNVSVLISEKSPIGQAYAVNWVTQPVAPAAGTVTGNVTVADGTGATCTAPVAAGTCSLTSTVPGLKTIVASYQGDDNFLESSSNGVFHPVVILIAGKVMNMVSFGSPVPLPGVLVTILGSVTGEAISDAAGNYSFASLVPAGDYTVTPTGFGLTYSPTERSYTAVTQNIADADFFAANGPVVVPSPTPNATPTPGVTPTPVPSPTASPVATPTPAATPTPNPSPTPSATPTPDPAGMGGEGDVVDASGVPVGGDGVKENDLNVVRDFALSKTQADVNALQFQRGDTAPRTPASNQFGDGMIDASDVTIVRLYSLGMLPGTSAAGPVVPDVAPTPIVMPDNPRVIRAVNVGTRPGEFVTVRLEMNAQGDESSASFTVDYDESVLSDPIVSLGNGVSEGTHLGTNVSHLSEGKIGILFDSVNAYAAGIRQVISIRFRVADNAQIGLYPVTFEHGPTGKSVSSYAGVLLPTTYQTGYVQIGSTAAGVSLSGRVTTPSGQGLRNAAVTIADNEGNKRTVTTGSFGFFRFDNVEAGKPYVVSVAGKRYRFAARIVNVVDSLTDVNFIGQE